MKEDGNLEGRETALTNNRKLDKEKLVTELNIKINQELSKPMEEIDMDLVDECMAFLDEIDGDKYKPNEHEKQKRLAELSQLISEKYKTKSPRKKPWTGWKNTLIAVTCVVLLMSASVFVCAAVWQITPSDVLSRWGKAIFSLPYDEEINESGFTFIFPEDTKKYSSLSEFAESESYEILLPEWLPEDVKVESIIYTEANKNEEISIKFTNQSLFYSVLLNQTINYDSWDFVAQDSFGSITYYTFEHEYGFEIRFNHDNNSYSIIYNDMDIIITILKNLKIQE